jgi:flagellar basal-body rod protein FlgC
MSAIGDVFAVSRAGLSIERQRLEAATNNIANATTTREPGGALYRPLRVVSTSGAADIGFEQLMEGDTAALVPTAQLVAIDAPVKRVLDPSHPHAGPDGFVEMPGINAAFEMIQIMAAVRSYEANIKAIGALKTMISSALQLGRNG